MVHTWLTKNGSLRPKTKMPTGPRSTMKLSTCKYIVFCCVGQGGYNHHSLQHHWERGADDGLRAAHRSQGLLLWSGRQAYRGLCHAVEGYHGPGTNIFQGFL